jgi:hypothetical protein
LPEPSARAYGLDKREKHKDNGKVSDGREPLVTKSVTDLSETASADQVDDRCARPPAPGAGRHIDGCKDCKVGVKSVFGGCAMASKKVAQ